MLAESRPSPWLGHIITAVITVSGVVYNVATRDTDLRHLEERVTKVERRAESLEAYRSDLRELLAGIRADVKRATDDISEMRQEMRDALGVRRAAR